MHYQKTHFFKTLQKHKSNATKRFVSLLSVGIITATSIIPSSFLAKAEEQFTYGSATPDLVITEIYTDDIERKDYNTIYELCGFVEVYNTSDHEINITDDYAVKYYNGSWAKDLTVTVPFTGEDAVIQPHSVAILWNTRSDKANFTMPLTVEDFKDLMNISNDVPVFTLNGQAFSHSNRKFALENKKSGTLESQYLFTANDIADGKSVELEYDENGTQIPWNQKTTPTPGVIKDNQISIKIPDDDGHYPSITQQENISEIEEGKDLTMRYTFEESLGMKSVSVFYKTDKDTDYSVITTSSFRIPNNYFIQIPADKLLGCNYVDYYVKASSVVRSTTTGTKRVKINKVDDFDGIRTNISANEVLNNDKLLIAKDSTGADVAISFDNEAVSKTSLLEKGAFFTLSYNNLNQYHKNGVTVGDHILDYFAKWSYTLPSKAVLVDQSLFNYNEDGSADITLTVWSGTYGNIFETDSDIDEYTLTGTTLVLTDGTILTPDNDVDPNKVYQFGDSKDTYLKKLDIHFTIPADKVNASGYTLDTSKYSDGNHTLKYTSSTTSKEVPVIIDNTAPSIKANLSDEQTVSGDFTLNLDITDTNGVDFDTLEVMLDDYELEAPYTFNCTSLSEGSHTIKATVSDTVGNNSEKVFTFTAKDGRATLDSANNNTLKDGSVQLTANVKSADENTSVDFYKAQSLEIGKEIKVLSGTGDSTENAVDSELGTVTSTDSQYPYQVFEINTDGDATDTMQIKFDADVNYSDPVNAYVYNYKNNNWDKLDTYINDTKTYADLSLTDRVEDQKVKIMLQARSNESSPVDKAAKNNTVANDYKWDGTDVPEQYDFSFAWITDTQYYAESYQQNFLTMNNWIAENKDKYDIEYLIHTGDIVDEFEMTYQWENADDAMKIIENADIPYGVLAGNHDVASGNEEYDNYYKYFGENRFKNNSVFSGTYKNNLGHYDLVTVDGQEMIILYMSWDIYDNEVAWMNQVLQQYSDRKAIICLHSYINEKAELSYTGKLIQEEVVAKNPNVFAVLNGHFHGSAINVTAFDDNNDGVNDRDVYQICTDYQSAKEGGLSYIKMLYFDLHNNKVYMNSYSPLLNDTNYFDAEKLDSYSAGTIVSNHDICEISTDFNVPERSLTTKSFEANLYSDTKIGETTIKDDTYSTIWSGLTEGTNYEWCVKTTNTKNTGLNYYSAVYQFTYKKPEVVIQPDSNPDSKPDSKPDSNPDSKPQPTPDKSQDTTQGSTSNGQSDSVPDKSLKIDTETPSVTESLISKDAIILDQYNKPLTDTDVKLVIKPATAEHQKQINEKLLQNGIHTEPKDMVDYFNIDLQDNSSNVVKLSNGTVKITFNVKEGIDLNKYEVLVYHILDNGSVENLPVTVGSDKFDITTKSFSPYVVVYREKTAITQPNSQAGTDNRTVQQTDNNNTADQNTNTSDTANDNVKTADYNAIGLYLMLVCLTGVLLIYAKKKKILVK